MHTCDFCKARATYDGKTTVGPWAYMCQVHFDLYGIKESGLYTVLPLSNPATLCCSICKECKPVTDFYKYVDRHGVERYRTECRTCNLLKRKLASLRR